MAKKIIKKADSQSEDEKFPLPEYSPKDDIYQNAKEESLDDEDSKKIKGKGKSRADDLDIPGSELDDKDEAIGEEDEENNYYSLGGDDHNDLEDDQA